MNDVLIEISQVDSSFMPYIVVYSPEDLQKMDFPKVFEENQIGINKMFNRFINESEKPFSYDLKTKLYQSNKKMTPKVVFLQNIINEVRNDLNLIKEDYYNKQVTITSRLMLFVTNCNQNNISCCFEHALYEEKVRNRLYSDKSFAKLLFRLKSLDNYCCRLEKNTVCLNVDLDSIKQKLTEASSQSDKSIEFAAYGPFDETFMDFIVEKNTLQRFSIAASRIQSSIMYSILDLNEADHIYKSFLMLFEVAGSKERYVVLSSVIRVLFDQMYTMFLSSSFSTGISCVFLENCQKMKMKTAIELKISANLLQSDQMDIPFSQVVLKSSHLTTATNCLFSVCMYNNPLDIVYEIFKAVKLIDAFVLDNMSQTGSSNQPLTTSMSFDDIFSIFSAVFVQNPPPNATSISTTLANMKNLQLSSAFDFAKLLFGSAVDYVNQSNLQNCE